jgi:hypothetical protein
MKVTIKKMFRWIRVPGGKWRRRRDSYYTLDEDFIGYESFSLHTQTDTAARSKNVDPALLPKHLKGI